MLLNLNLLLKISTSKGGFRTNECYEGRIRLDGRGQSLGLERPASLWVSGHRPSNGLSPLEITDASIAAPGVWFRLLMVGWSQSVKDRKTSFRSRILLAGRLL